MCGIPFTRESLDLTKYVLARGTIIGGDKRCFWKDFVDFLLIQLNKNLLLTMILLWLAETDRNIQSRQYSIIGKHSQAYGGTADTELVLHQEMRFSF